MAHGMRESRGWLLFICTATHVFVHVFTMMHVALIPVFMEEFSLSIYEAGFLASMPQTLSILVSLPYGFISDRIDPRKLMAISLLMAGFSGLAASYARNFIMLLIFVSFIPLSSMIYHPPVLKIVSEMFPDRRQSRVLGIHGAGGALGVAIGPITLGLMLERFGWRFSYLVWCVPVLLSVLLTLTLPYVGAGEKREVAGGSGESAENKNGELNDARRGYLLLLLAMGVDSIGKQALSAYMTTYMVSVRDFSESNASLLFGLNPFIGIFGSLAGGYLGARFGSKRWMITAYVVRALAYLGIWLGPLWMLAPVYLTGGFFGTSALGPMSTLIARYSPAERRGLAYTVSMMLPSLVGSVSPLIAAWLIEGFSIIGLFPFTIALTLLSASVLQTLPKEDRFYNLERKLTH